VQRPSEPSARGTVPNPSPLEAVAKRVTGELSKPRPNALRGVRGVLKPRSEPAKPVMQPGFTGVRG
jgi:hypothetical protein